MEACFEPKLQRQIVPCLIGEVGPQFVLITFSQDVLVQLPCSGKKLGIFQVHRAISNQFGENQIVNFKSQQPQARKLARKKRRQADRIILRNIRDGDLLKVQAVLLGHRRISARDSFQIREGGQGYCGDIIYISRRTRETKDCGQYKSAQAMQLHGRIEALVNF